ncbi:MAG: glycosyltransferase family 2 protein [Saccharofermentans sp.]|nr:glycosyltransferase family 2 protein [Saccharofermentans sp.]
MLSIIVPAYNEGKSIRQNLLQICEVISQTVDDFEVIPVNDGSPDNTLEEINKAVENPASNGKIHPVTYDVNRGKGGAIKAGVMAARGEYIGFLDADLDISPDHIANYYAAMVSSGCDVVIGSKMHKESKLDYPFARKVFSWCYFIMLKVLFGLSVLDTQTGVKLYNGELIKTIVPQLRVDGFAFDIEILALAASKKAVIKQMPVSIIFSRNESFGRIKFKDVWKMFTDTWKIWWDLKVRRNY